jgi:hypothetical protein
MSDPPGSLSALAAIPAARARLDADELALIDQARRAGATWADIASALGLASRQAAEQRRLRLATAASRPDRPDLDLGYGESVAHLRAAALELHRRIGADRRWDRRFRRAALVRATLAAVPDAAPSALFALVTDVVADLDGGASGPATLPGPLRSAAERLRQALIGASPRP